MNTFTRSVSQVFTGAFRTFRTFPVSIGSALAFTAVTLIRIQLDWPQQEPYSFLLSCLNWSFAFGAIFGLAAITAARSRTSHAKSLLIANLLGVAAIAVVFAGLYLLGGTVREGTSYAVVSSLAVARVSAAMLASFIAFIILAGNPKDRSDFTLSFFMTHKAFFIALLYGGVILAGASGVTRAVQSLLYQDMSGKVYMVISTLVGFLTYTIFVGYFPDFRVGEDIARREVAQKQPRFIEILFGYIMIPIMLALTVVLLIWAFKTVLDGMDVDFVLLSAIAASYTIAGLWLHAMVSGHHSGLAKVYRRIYPIASLVILVFEAWAVILQLSRSGLKDTEYFFILLWIVAAVGCALLLIMKAKAHEKIAVLIGALAILAVLPLVGYHALPVTAQSARLEALLDSQGMLEGGQIVPASSTPDKAVRESITDAVYYLATAQNARLPVWFDTALAQSDVFRSKLGFEQTWPGTNGNTTPEFIGTYLSLSSGAIDISGYRWVVNPQDYKNEQQPATVDGKNGTYEITWESGSGGGIPTLTITLSGRVILQQDLSAYIDTVSAKYPPGQNQSITASLEDMRLQLETPEANILLVFNYVGISVDTATGDTTYQLDLNGLYLKENP